MIVIKRVLPILLGAWVLVIAMPAVAQYAEVTTAWPYGVVIWVGGKPDDAAAITNEFITATSEVFTFWKMPIPVPGPSWASAVQTSSASPPMPGTANYRMLQPSWNGRSVLPLIIAFFPNSELMHVSWDNFVFAGQFDYPPNPNGKTSPDITLTSMVWDYPPGFILTYRRRAYDLISIAREPHWQDILRHELGHWLFTMWCQKRGIDVDSFPKLVQEGFADYTRHALSNNPDQQWKKVAAIWTQYGGLDNVPPSLVYDVGTSLIAYIVTQNGQAGFWRMLPQLAADWKAQATALVPGWRKWLDTVSISTGDQALYEARLERLYTCALLLKPVLPQQAWDLVCRLKAGTGTMDDIDQFWKIVHTRLITPRIDGWNDLIHREDSLLLVGIWDDDDTTTIDYLQSLVLKLKSAWYHWGKYRPLYITGIIDSIARWGHVPKGEK